MYPHQLSTPFPQIILALPWVLLLAQAGRLSLNETELELRSTGSTTSREAKNSSLEVFEATRYHRYVNGSVQAASPGKPCGGTRQCGDRYTYTCREVIEDWNRRAASDFNNRQQCPNTCVCVKKVTQHAMFQPCTSPWLCASGCCVSGICSSPCGALETNVQMPWQKRASLCGYKVIVRQLAKVRNAWWSIFQRRAACEEKPDIVPLEHTKQQWVKGHSAEKTEKQHGSSGLAVAGNLRPFNGRGGFVSMTPG